MKYWGEKMNQISKAQSKGSKQLCEQMAGQCQAAKPSISAMENFKRKPYYMFTSKLYEDGEIEKTIN